MRRNLLFLSALLALTLTILWPVGRLGFIIYDDFDYVSQNPVVQSGLNLKSIVWAFTSAWSSNWHPLTWLSHMLDCQLFGLNPHEEHWVNLGFHTANTLLLFLWLKQLTGARWRSLLVAALFAIHPLHLQSVAWISERKDVLSGFFALLTLLAYTRYCRHKTGGNYIIVVLLFALGLMAKPMLVTLPVIMLLLDYWPLGRMAATGSSKTPLKSRLQGWITLWQPLFVEKTPLMLLCLASCIVTMWAQNASGSVISMQAMVWQERYLHAVVSYSLYLGKLFWPVDLAIFYPFSRLATDDLIGLVLLPVLLSAICLWCGRVKPHLLVGWFWYVIMLIPVIGIVQVGMQTMADRYAYLPSIGLFIAGVWAMADIAAWSKSWRLGMAGAGLILLAACGMDTRHQLGFWRDSVSLSKHVLEVSPENNFLGHYYLGNSYGNIGDLTNAADNFTQSLDADPGFIEARAKLGYVLLLQEKYPEAEFQFREILKQRPGNIYAHRSLGLALVGRQRDAEALTEYQAARQLQPDDAKTSELLAVATRRAGAERDLTNLFNQFKTNDTPKIHSQIGAVQNFLGNYQAAVDEYQIALRMSPDSLEALNNLAWLLATCPDASVRDGQRAVQLAGQACKLTQFKTTVFLGTLAAADAEAGRFDDAIVTAQKACANAAARKENELLQRNHELLALYQKHQPYHEAAEKLVPAAP